MSLEIVIIPCLRDNYAYLLRDGETGYVGLIDAPEASPIDSELANRGWALDTIFITHHHSDHIGAVDELRRRYNCQVIGAEADRLRLPALDIGVAEGDKVSLGASVATVMETPGHTVGHIVFFFEDDRALFSADSLMVMGCGRLFEGTPEQMWDSLSRMASLPGDTKIYSGHEYTQSNVNFAQSVDPDNQTLKNRSDDISRTRSQNRPTIPADLKLELATNPFLRASNPELRAYLKMEANTDTEVFAEIRRRKDVF